MLTLRWNVDSVAKCWLRFVIVSRGDWLWNPANFKGWFSLVTWSRQCTTVMLRWRPEYRRNRSSNQTFWFWLLNLLLIYRISSWQEILVSCLAVAQVEGPQELGIWKLPNAKEEDHKKMEGRLARGNYEDKRSWSPLCFTRQVENDKVFTCEKNFHS